MKSIIALTFSLLGFIILLPAAIINVPADYVTIQAAVNAAVDGDIIIVANGSYSESINLNSMATPGDITIQAQNTGGATVDGGASSAFKVGTFSGAITIEGFRLDANTGIVNGVIDLLNVSGRVRVISNTFLSGYGGTAIYMLNTTSANTALSVLDNVASGAVDNDDFVFVQVGEDATGGGTTDILVDGNTVSDLEDAGVQIELEGTGYTATIRVSDNNMSAWAASGSGIAVNLGKGSIGTNIEAYVSIEGNTITNPDGRAISLDADGINTTMYATVADNVLTGNVNSSNGIGLDGDSSSDGVTVHASITGNNISNFTGSGIWMRPFADDVNRDNWNLIVDNNTISNIDTDGNGANEEAAIDLADDSGVDDENYTVNIEVTNNTMSSIPATAEEILIERPTTTTVSTATVNYTISGNSHAATLRGAPTSVGDAVGPAEMLANIGDFVWDDTNMDGIQDGGELGIAGINLNLTGAGINVDVQTDADGNYLFPSLFSGTYTLTVSTNTDYPSISTSDQGGNDAVDSDFDGSGNSTVIMVGGTGNDVSVDVALNSTPLPVELLDFVANVQNENVALIWYTATEVNSRGFSIERKTSVGSFEEIAFVEGVGNSTKIQSYRFVDEKVEPGDNYFYRLKQIDINGQFSLSDVIEISLIDNPQINCFPNPVSNQLHIESQSEIKKVEIFDLSGKMLLIQEFHKLNPTLDVSSLMNGYFWVRVTDQNGRSFQQIIEK